MFLLMVEINFTKNLTGITFAKMEWRSETFADDTTIILQRSAKNLTFAKKYLTDFHTQGQWAVLQRGEDQCHPFLDEH